MGKNTGFLEYNRKDNNTIAPQDRLQNFKEFHTQLSLDERIKQAARCMNCGVPLCQSAMKLSGMVTGCPLHNLIPEWNDALYNEQYFLAATRLFKTSNFPEFTSRVCPALCEKACNCGNGEDVAQAVSVRDNELFIVEKAFENGYLNNRAPKERTDKKIAVIGSGPSGLAVADMLNRRGHNVTVFEKEDRIGGLLMYGIPNMKLDKSIVDRRVELMKNEGVNFVTSCNIGVDYKADQLINDFDAIALCCGAKQARGLNVANADANGVIYAVDFLTSVTKSLLNSNLNDGMFFNPQGKDVIVVGGGDTGNDCTGTCLRLGANRVTQLEMMPKPSEVRQESNPWPEWPKTLKTDYGQEEAILLQGEDPRVYQTTIKEIYVNQGNVCGVKTVKVEFQNIDGKRQLVEIAGSEQELKADLILIAAGFTGCQKYVADDFGIELSNRGTIPTENENTYSTNIDKVFTAGDMHRGQSLVVWAIAEGRNCARQIDEYLMGYTNM